jgi:hypothetical protein
MSGTDRMRVCSSVSVPAGESTKMQKKYSASLSHLPAGQPWKVFSCFFNHRGTLLIGRNLPQKKYNFVKRLTSARISG